MLSITFRPNRLRVFGEEISLDVNWGDESIPTEVLNKAALVIHEGFSASLAELFMGLCEMGAAFYLEVGEGSGHAR